MKFSETFGIEVEENDGWFDPILSIDTKLFIDPFLLYDLEDEINEFAGSHAEVIAFFNCVFELIAKGGRDTKSNSWKRGVGLLRFPEASELCLGYTTKGTSGSGSGAGFAKSIAEAILEAIIAGVKEVNHFEEISILRENIGADRISDITANLLRHRFAQYTKRICDKYKIPTKKWPHPHGFFDPKAMRWTRTVFELPENPHTKGPVMLCPKNFLRELPTINPSDFWDYCFENENETLRAEYGADIQSKVERKYIIGFARKHPDIRQEYLKYVEEAGAEPYDFDQDRLGYENWYEPTKKHCADNPLGFTYTDEASFIAAVDKMISQFQNFVENQGGWRLLWNDDGSAKREEAAQRVFLGIVMHYCHANNIDISSEANIGRGPVDFKVSQGHLLRALMELKKANNGKFWNGLHRQLPKYQQAEGIRNGYFVVIVLTDNHIKKLEDIEAQVKAVNQELPFSIKAVVIDGRRNPASASKL